MDDFAEWLNRRMVVQGLSQRALAKKVGVASSAITRWANGTGRPSSESFVKLAAALDLNVEDVYDV